MVLVLTEGNSYSPGEFLWNLFPSLHTEDLMSDKMPCQEQVWLLMLFHMERSGFVGEFLRLKCGSCFLRCSQRDSLFVVTVSCFSTYPYKIQHFLRLDVILPEMSVCTNFDDIFCCFHRNSKPSNSLSLFRGLDYPLWLLHSVAVCFIVKIHLRTGEVEWPMQCKHVWLIPLIWCCLGFNILGWKIMSECSCHKGWERGKKHLPLDVKNNLARL